MRMGRKLIRSKVEKNEDGLTPRMERFITEYFCSLDRVAAAQKVGSKLPFADAERWSNHPAVIKAVRKRQRLYEIDVDTMAVRVLQQLCRIAFFDIGSLYDENGKFKGILDIDEESRAAISSFTRTVRITGNGEDAEAFAVYNIKTHSPMPALELLTKHLGLLERDNMQKGIAEAMGKLINSMLDALPPDVAEGVMESLGGSDSLALPAEFSVVPKKVNGGNGKGKG